MSTWSGWDSFCSSGQWFHIKVGGVPKNLFFSLYEIRMETDLNKDVQSQGEHVSPAFVLLGSLLQP